MAPRKILRSSTYQHRSRSSSPDLPTNTSENVQHTAQARPRGRVIPDSQEDPSDLELSGSEAKDDLEDDFEAESVTAGTKHQPSNPNTDEDPDAPQAVLEVDDSEDSFQTVDTVIIPGGAKLTAKRNVSRSIESQHSIAASRQPPPPSSRFESCRLKAYLYYIRAQRYQST